MPGQAIILNGVEVPIVDETNLVRVIHYRESGLEFTKQNTKFVMPRDPAVKIDLITAHDQAGEGQGETFFDNIRLRGDPPGSNGLSVHFQIGHSLLEVDGKARAIIYQFNDPITTATAHMGKGNGRSIGVEHSNRFSKLLYIGKPLRPLVKETYRSRNRTVLGHLEGQKIAFACLVRTLLANIVTIPSRLPRDPSGKITGERLDAKWAGVAGHHHFQESGFVSARAHVDPCMDILSYLEAELG